MWPILTNIITSAAVLMLQSSQPNTRDSSKSNHVGMSCNIPHHQDFTRSVSCTSQTINCNNCSNSSSGNAGNKKQSQKTSTRNQNIQSNNNALKIALPSNGNYEIKIKRVESDFAKMGQSGSTSSQNTQKVHSSNNSKPKRQDTNQRPQNRRNQNQQNVNQRQQNSDQNKQNFNGNQNKQNRNQRQQNGSQIKPNSNQGTAKFENDRQANQIQVSTNANGHSQIKMGGNDKNHKPGNLKFGKNRLSNQNTHVNNGRYNKPTGQNGYGHHQTTWMYLGRLKVDTTEFDIKNYLQQKFPRYDFIVEALPLYKHAKLPCFKVNVKNTILDDFQNLENWPNGVKITKFQENFKT